jgi:hypothetical protein
MGWDRELAFGDYELRLAFGRTASLDRRAGQETTGHDIVRLGGQRLRIALRHRDWNDLSESERWDRIHDHYC